MRHLLSIAICQWELGIGRSSVLYLHQCVYIKYIGKGLKRILYLRGFWNTSNTADGDIKNHTFAGEVKPDSLFELICMIDPPMPRYVVPLADYISPGEITRPYISLVSCETTATNITSRKAECVSYILSYY